MNGKTTYTGRINEAIYIVDGDTLRFVYEYDVFSNITRITKYINNVVDYVEENTYDIFDQLTKQALTKENVTYSTSYTYDSRGNVTSIIESNETEGDITSSIIFTYNDRNELLTVNDNGTLYTNSYNTKGMLTKYLNWNISYDMRNISFLENPEKFIEFKNIIRFFIFAPWSHPRGKSFKILKYYLREITQALSTFVIFSTVFNLVMGIFLLRVILLYIVSLNIFSF